MTWPQSVAVSAPGWSCSGGKLDHLSSSSLILEDRFGKTKTPARGQFLKARSNRGKIYSSEPKLNSKRSSALEHLGTSFRSVRLRRKAARPFTRGHLKATCQKISK